MFEVEGDEVQADPVPGRATDYPNALRVGGVAEERRELAIATVVRRWNNLQLSVKMPTYLSG